MNIVLVSYTILHDAGRVYGYWTTRGCHRRLCVLSFRSFGCMRDRELSSPRLVQSASWQSVSWRIRELSSYRVYKERSLSRLYRTSRVLQRHCVQSHFHRVLFNSISRP